MRLDGKTVLRHLYPRTYERLIAQHRSQRHETLVDALRKYLSVDPEPEDGEDVIVPDPLARALAKILVDKGIATEEEIQRLADEFASE